MRAPLAVGLGALAGAVHLRLTDPYRPGAPLLVCPVHALTGYLCAGCGGQRAVHELVTLDPAAAWGMNPLVVLAAPLAVLAWLRWLGRSRRAGRWVVAGSGTSPGRRGGSVRAPWLSLAVVVVFTVLRNVPALAPWLAP